MLTITREKKLNWALEEEKDQEIIFLWNLNEIDTVSISFKFHKKMIS